MLPDPMHPIVVHFPVVLSVLLPFVAAGALFAIKGGARPVRAWGVAMAVSAALSLSAWVAVETGEEQEERVEDIVGEARLDTHADAGQVLLYTSTAVLAVFALGLLPGAKGRVARYAGTAGTLVVAGMAFRVGMTGGDLVYKYDAASAYSTPTAADTGAVAIEARGETGESERTERNEARER